MMVLAYEWKKLMIGQRGLACLLAALVVSGVWLAATEQPQNIAMQEHRSDYVWCLERLDGALNDQKEAWLHGSESRPCRSAGKLLQRPHLG